jgi:hypothetical protein
VLRKYSTPSETTAEGGKRRRKGEMTVAPVTGSQRGWPCTTHSGTKKERSGLRETAPTLTEDDKNKTEKLKAEQRQL